MIFLAAAAAALGVSPAVGAQDQAVPAAPSVTVPVVVREHKGGAVAGLAKDNFTIKVDGTAQPVSATVAGAGEHVTYGLLVDVSAGQKGAIDGERKAARALVGSLKPGDQMFVVHFAKDIELLQGPTDDKEKLEKALNELGTASSSFHISDPKGGQVDEEGRKIHAGGTSLNDALFLSADEVLAKDKNRHVIVVISDGVDVGSKESISETTDALQRARAVVYTMYSRNVDPFSDRKRDRGYNQGGGRNGGGWPGGGYPGGGYPGGGYPGGGYPGGGYPGGGGNNPNGGNQDPNNPNNRNPNDRDSDPAHKPNIDGQRVLEKLSQQTGGRLFDASKRGVEGNFNEIADEVHTAYWVSFTPQGPAAKHGYHSFDISVEGSDKSHKVDVQAPQGYYTGS